MAVPNQQTDTQRSRNQATYRRIKTDVDAQFPKGWFVAVTERGVIADAQSFDELDAKLDQLGPLADNAVVAQAGDNLPDYAVIINV